METAEHYSSEHPENVFDWLRVLNVALARKAIKPSHVALANFVAMAGDNVSGTNCRIDIDRWAIEFNVDRATVYRWLKDLVDQGWLEQTRKPSYRGPKKGQKALYRVAWPRLDLRHESAPESCRIATPDDATDDTEAPGVVSQIAESRVAKQAESCRIATPDDAPLPTSYGPTSDAPTCPTPNFDDASSVRATPSNTFAPGWPVDDECARCGDTRDVHQAASPVDRLRSQLRRADGTSSDQWQADATEASS